MQSIHIHRYRDVEGELPPDTHQVSEFWQGYVEPDDLSWILFVDVEGRITLFDQRDPETGAVLTA